MDVKSVELGQTIAKSDHAPVESGWQRTKPNNLAGWTWGHAKPNWWVSLSVGLAWTSNVRWSSRILVRPPLSDSTGGHYRIGEQRSVPDPVSSAWASRFIWVARLLSLSNKSARHCWNACIWWGGYFSQCVHISQILWGMKQVMDESNTLIDPWIPQSIAK